MKRVAWSRLLLSSLLAAWVAACGAAGGTSDEAQSGGNVAPTPGATTPTTTTPQVSQPGQNDVTTEPNGATGTGSTTPQAAGFLLTTLEYEGFCLQLPALTASANTALVLGGCDGAPTQIFRWKQGNLLAANNLCVAIPLADNAAVSVMDCSLTPPGAATLGAYTFSFGLYRSEGNQIVWPAIVPAGNGNAPVAGQTVVARRDTFNSWVRRLPPNTDGFALRWLGATNTCAAAEAGNVVLAPCDENAAAQRWSFTADNRGLANLGQPLLAGEGNDAPAILGQAGATAPEALTVGAGITAANVGGVSGNTRALVGRAASRRVAFDAVTTTTDSSRWLLGNDDVTYSARP